MSVLVTYKPYVTQNTNKRSEFYLMMVKYLIRCINIWYRQIL